MKISFIGGGSHRLLSILRGAMGIPEILDGGEIRLYDLNNKRAETMVAMLRKTPEYVEIKCDITAYSSIEKAIEGVDVVCSIFMAGSQESHAKSIMASLDCNFIGTDNLSPSGSILGVKTGAIVLSLARKMERLCPKAILLNFCNPTAVLSGLVNNYTKIQALGVCEGVNNHRWDLRRILGKDERSMDFDVDAAGINHLCFVIKGTYQNENVFSVIDNAVNGKWKPPEIICVSCNKHLLRNGLRRIVKIYKELGVLLYSGESDGTAHLCYNEVLQEFKQREFVAGADTYARRLRFHSRFSPRKRREMEQTFLQWLTRELDNNFWEKYPAKDIRFRRDNHSVFLQALQGVAKLKRIKMTSSRPNSGAIDGIGERCVTEYSQIIFGNKILSAGKYKIPDVVHGLVDSLAVHQTMLGDAIAVQDPKLLAKAFLAYPVRPYSLEARKLYKRLAKINRSEISKELQSFSEYL